MVQLHLIVLIYNSRNSKSQIDNNHQERLIQSSTIVEIQKVKQTGSLAMHGSMNLQQQKFKKSNRPKEQASQAITSTIVEIQKVKQTGKMKELELTISTIVEIQKVKQTPNLRNAQSGIYNSRNSKSQIDMAEEIARQTNLQQQKFKKSNRLNCGVCSVCRESTIVEIQKVKQTKGGSVQQDNNLQQQKFKKSNRTKEYHSC